MKLTIDPCGQGCDDPGAFTRFYNGHKYDQGRWKSQPFGNHLADQALPAWFKIDENGDAVVEGVIDTKNANLWGGCTGCELNPGSGVFTVYDKDGNSQTTINIDVNGAYYYADEGGTDLGDVTVSDDLTKLSFKFTLSGLSDGDNIQFCIDTKECENPKRLTQTTKNWCFNIGFFNKECFEYNVHDTFVLRGCRLVVCPLDLCDSTDKPTLFVDGKAVGYFNPSSKMYEDFGVAGYLKSNISMTYWTNYPATADVQPSSGFIQIVAHTPLAANTEVKVVYGNQEYVCGKCSTLCTFTSEDLDGKVGTDAVVNSLIVDGVELLHGDSTVAAPDVATLVTNLNTYFGFVEDFAQATDAITIESVQNFESITLNEDPEGTGTDETFTFTNSCDS